MRKPPPYSSGGFHRRCELRSHVASTSLGQLEPLIASSRVSRRQGRIGGPGRFRCRAGQSGVQVHVAAIGSVAVAAGSPDAGQHVLGHVRINDVGPLVGGRIGIHILINAPNVIASVGVHVASSGGGGGLEVDMRVVGDSAAVGTRCAVSGAVAAGRDRRVVEVDYVAGEVMNWHLKAPC